MLIHNIVLRLYIEINLVMFKEKLTLLSLFIMDKNLYNYYTSLSGIRNLFSRPN